MIIFRTFAAVKIYDHKMTRNEFKMTEWQYNALIVQVLQPL